MYLLLRLAVHTIQCHYYYYHDIILSNVQMFGCLCWWLFSQRYSYMATHIYTGHTACLYTFLRMPGYFAASCCSLSCLLLMSPSSSVESSWPPDVWVNKQEISLFTTVPSSTDQLRTKYEVAHTCAKLFLLWALISTYKAGIRLLELT